MTAASSVTQFSFTSAKIYSSIGAEVDVKYVIEDLNIYQDISHSTLSGDMILKDAQNLLTKLAFCGNEYLYLNFESPSQLPFEKYFRIYKISDVRFINSTSLRYKIHFCSEEFILNQQARISKSYNGKKTSEIANDILINTLKVNPSKFVAGKDYEETVTPQKIIIPNMRAFEAINWISSFSIDQKLSSAFLFFETQTGFKFKSLRKLIETPGYSTYTLNPQSLVATGDDKTANKFVLNNLEIEQSFDILSTMSKGGFSSKMMSLDMTHGEVKLTGFNPVNAKTKKINDYLPFNEATNRFGSTLIDDSQYIKYFPNFQGDLIDKWLLQKAAQLSLLNNNKIKISIYGDSQIEAGMIVGLDFPDISPVNDSQKIQRDNYKSGSYLVTKVKHRIFENKFTTNLELCKDSNISAFPSAVETQGYIKAKTS